MRRPWRPVTLGGLARAALGVSGLLLVLAMVFVGVFVAVLAHGPINLENLKPSIARSLEDRLGPRYKVAIGPMALMRGPSGLGLGFGGIEIRDAQGRVIVAAPSGKVGLDVLSLMMLEVKVRRLELDGLEVKMRVRPDGSLSVAASSVKDAASLELGPPPAGAPADLASVAAGLIEAMAGSQQALDHVSVLKGRLEVANEALVRTSVFQDFSLAFDKDGDGARVAVGAKGPSGAWQINASATGGAKRSLSVEVRDIALDDLILLSKTRPPFESDMPISARLDATLTPEGALKTMSGHFGLGAGYFNTDDPDQEPLLLDEATGKVLWDAAEARFRLDHVEALASATHFRFDGWLAPPAAAEPTWRAHLQSKDIVLGGERPGEQAVELDDVALDAHFLPMEARLTLDRLSVHGPRVKGEMSGEVAVVADGPTMKLDIKVGQSALLDLVRLWPSAVNPEARSWCIDNIKGGELLSGSMKLDWDSKMFADALAKKAVPADSVHGEFSARDAVLTLLPGVPPATGVDGVGLITGRVFSMTGKHGVIELAPGRRIQGSDLYFKVPDTTPAAIVPAQGGAHLTGSADALADLLSREAIKHFAGFAVDPASVKGQFQGQLTLDLGLGKDIKPENQKFRAEGSVTNLQLDKFLSNERFEQGALEVSADSGNLKITGQGLINGLAAKVELIKASTEEGSVLLTVALDDSARSKLGFNLAPTIQGPMTVKVKAPLGKSSLDVEVDLAKVTIDSPEGAVLKAAGKPGKATFNVKQAADAVSISAISLEAGPLQAKGSGQFSPEGALQSLKLTSLRLGAGDDLKLDLTGGAVQKAVVRGASLDGRSLIKGFLSHDVNSGGVHDLDLDVKIAAVTGANKQSLGQLELTMSRRGGVVRALQAKAQLGEGPIIVKRDDSGVVAVHAEDAGAFARFLDLYAKMEGGSLDLTLREAADGSHGIAAIKKFVLRNEPALRRLAAAGVQASGAASIDPDAIKFERMTAQFTRSSGRLDLQEALIFNRDVGLTTQGFIDYANDKVDLNGTFVPAYQVNSLITNVPIVGTLLGGGQHEGIFGVNYRITGPASAPTLTVNPLSGVTPGILRKIFGVVDGTTPAPTSPPPPNAYAPIQGK